jgi:predicted dienelactone hydrolase
MKTSTWVVVVLALAGLVASGCCIVPLGLLAIHRARQPVPSVTEEATPPPDRAARTRQPREGDAGFRKMTFSYRGSDGAARSRSVYLWYPSATAARRHDYNGQIGHVAAEGVVAKGTHPLILFSHGFLGAADQTIFLMEELARHGYIVAAVNHADASTTRRAKPVAWPNFVDAKSWDEKKYLDRKEDLVALLDHLLALHHQRGAPLHGRIDEGAIGAAGDSLGGYTVLGLVGARPAWRDARVRAALLLSPFATPYLTQGDLGAIRAPVMLQGGTLDWGITPFLLPIYDRLRTTKYFLVLKNETHFGWTNLISLGKTTTECVQQGNAELMARYSIAFFHRHLCETAQDAVLRKAHPRLESYRFSEE